MNESVNGSVFGILQGMSNQLGIDASILGIIMAFCFMLVTPMFIYLRTMSMPLSVIGLVIASVIMFVMGLIPVWISPIVIVVSMLGVYKHSFIDDNSIPHNESMSESYADSLKRAYEAKFGYENPAFNEEVDAHIKAVENLRKGYTRAVHRDKLKRLEKFVEVKRG
jgi:phage shock protein PspC (stress-responsive transcriptional regulator)